MNKILFILLISITLLSNAIAEQSYIGASIGDSKVSSDSFSKPIGYKIFLGTHINDRFGVELGLINLGEFQSNVVSNKVSGTELSGVGFIPIGDDGSIFGKIGLFAWSIESSAGNINVTSTGTDFTIGLGIQFPIPLNDNTLLRLEYQEFRDIDDTDDDFTFLSVGLALMF